MTWPILVGMLVWGVLVLWLLDHMTGLAGAIPSIRSSLERIEHLLERIKDETGSVDTGIYEIKGSISRVEHLAERAWGNQYGDGCDSNSLADPCSQEIEPEADISSDSGATRS